MYQVNTVNLIYIYIHMSPIIVHVDFRWEKLSVAVVIVVVVSTGSQSQFTVQPGSQPKANKTGTAHTHIHAHSHTGPQIHTQYVDKGLWQSLDPYRIETPKRFTDRNRIRVINYKIWHFLFQIRERAHSQPFQFTNIRTYTHKHICMCIYAHKFNICVYICTYMYAYRTTMSSRCIAEGASMMMRTVGLQECRLQVQRQQQLLEGSSGKTVETGGKLIRSNGNE